MAPSPSISRPETFSIALTAAELSLAKEWSQARKDRDYQKADRIRSELREQWGGTVFEISKKMSGPALLADNPELRWARPFERAPCLLDYFRRGIPSRFSYAGLDRV